MHPCAKSGATNAFPLYSPAMTPPPTPLPLWRFLPALLRNHLRAIPEPVYHQPMFAPPHLRGRVAWVTDPKLVEELLLDVQIMHNLLTFAAAGHETTAKALTGRSICVCARRSGSNACPKKQTGSLAMAPCALNTSMLWSSHGKS